MECPKEDWTLVGILLVIIFNSLVFCFKAWGVNFRKVIQDIDTIKKAQKDMPTAVKQIDEMHVAHLGINARYEDGSVKWCNPDREVMKVHTELIHLIKNLQGVLTGFQTEQKESGLVLQKLFFKTESVLEELKGKK